MIPKLKRKHYSIFGASKCPCLTASSSLHPRGYHYLESDAHSPAFSLEYLVLVIYGCVINYPKPWQLKTIHIYYFTGFTVSNLRAASLGVLDPDLLRNRHQGFIQGLRHLKASPGLEMPSQGGTHTWLLARSSRSLPHELPECHDTWLPPKQVIQARA